MIVLLFAIGFRNVFKLFLTILIETDYFIVVIQEIYIAGVLCLKFTIILFFMAVLSTCLRLFLLFCSQNLQISKINLVMSVLNLLFLTKRVL